MNIVDTEGRPAATAARGQVSGAALSTVPREAAGRATCGGCLQLPLTTRPAATRTGADHMSNRKAVANAKLVGGSKVIAATAHD